MHGGFTIQLRPRNSFDGDKEALSTKKKKKKMAGFPAS